MSVTKLFHVTSISLPDTFHITFVMNSQHPDSFGLTRKAMKC